MYMYVCLYVIIAYVIHSLKKEFKKNTKKPYNQRMTIKSEKHWFNMFIGDVQTRLIKSKDRAIVGSMQVVT